MTEIPEEKRKGEKSSAIVLSLVFNAVLVVIKLAIGLVTGLSSVIAEALHSTNDVIGTAIVYFGIKKAQKPPDKEHPYGHGKIEVMTGWIENIFILLIGIGIVYEGVYKLLHKPTLEFLWAGIAIMIVSGILNWVISIYMINKGKNLRSVGIEVDGQHHLIDVVTSFGIAGALLLLRVTGWWWLDPAGAIVIGIWVMSIFFQLSNSLLHQAIDGGLNDSELLRIEALVKEFPEIKFYHKIRTRSSGSTIFIDMHVKMDKELTVECSHNVTREIESRLRKMYGDVNVLIHVEPYYGSENTGTSK